MKHFLLLPNLLICVLISAVTAVRVKDMIYMSIDGAVACFRRHNGTHQFGCSSPRSGSVGVIHVVESEDDLKWLETNSTAGPYSIVLHFEMFTRNTLTRLRRTNNVNGVLLTENTTLVAPPSPYSPEDLCPNRYSGYQTCDNTRPWNPYGSSLLLEDWPFPMFFVHNDTLLAEIKSCWKTHNAHSLETQNQRPLCALEMSSFMFSALNSESCLRRGRSAYNVNSMEFCDALGDQSLHWPLAPLEEKQSVILVVARMDSYSMYDEFSPGAGSAVTGFTTLLAIAHYLHSLNASVTHTNVIFSIFNGESFDYIGSSRFVYDLENGDFRLNGNKLSFDRVKAVIELGQLGQGNLYVHAKNHKKFELVTALKNELPAEVLDDSVPPASVQSFLKSRRNITTVVIANHGKQFVNKYYQSLFDNGDAIGFKSKKINALVKSLANVAVKLGNELYKSTMNSPVPSNSTSILNDLILNILSCYLESRACTLFRASTPPGTKPSDRPFPLYVSVAKVNNLGTIFTRQLFAFLTGTPIPQMNSTECHDRHLNWMGGYNFTGLCVNSTVIYSEALSPAFMIDDYDMKSGMYSTWTESVWSNLSVRMFLKSPPAIEYMVAILGSSVTVFSFILVWFINSKADILFASSRTADL